MTPTIKPEMKMTIHKDGTVSYWSVYRQQWARESTFDLANKLTEDYLAMPSADKRRICADAFKGMKNT